jgi:hypothetical protein
VIVEIDMVADPDPDSVWIQGYMVFAAGIDSIRAVFDSNDSCHLDRRPTLMLLPIPQHRDILPRIQVVHPRELIEIVDRIREALMQKPSVGMTLLDHELQELVVLLLQDLTSLQSQLRAGHCEPQKQLFAGHRNLLSSRIKNVTIHDASLGQKNLAQSPSLC